MALVRFTRRQPRVAFPGLIGNRPVTSLEDVENRLNRFIERAFTDPFGDGNVAESIGWVPAMEVAETEKEVTLTAELPGLDQKDVDVNVENGVLTVSGEKTEEKREEDKEKKFYLYERGYGSFQRSFALPAEVDAANISAEFAKGVLKVHMPKSVEAKAKGRKVEVVSK